MKLTRAQKESMLAEAVRLRKKLDEDLDKNRALIRALKEEMK